MRLRTSSIIPACIGSILALALTSVGQDTKGTPHASKVEQTRGERLLALHLEQAASYAIFRDAARKQPLELRREPVFRWTNPIRSGGQEGDVFLWTYQGRPEVIGTIFSFGLAGKRERDIWHELQSLSEATLVVNRDSPNRWEPRAAGIDPKPIPAAPTPAASSAQRAVQVRALAREFSGRSLREDGQGWELRLLTRPLHRYETPEVIDGSVLAFVSNAGTDPELILVLEARKTPEGPKWFYAPTRFSDMDLWLKHKDQEVWSSIRGGENTFNHDALHRYRLFEDRVVPEIDVEAPAAKGEPKKAEAK